jgi:hypothetical protein
MLDENGNTLILIEEISLKRFLISDAQGFSKQE